jgi:hypothetical protein
MHYRLNRVPARYRPLGDLIDPSTGADISTPITIDSSDTSTGDTSTGNTSTGTSTTPSWLNTLVTGATQFMLGQQQAQRINQLNQINIQRAAQGLPPLNVEMAGPGVSVGVSSGVQTIMYIGLGIAGLYVVSKILKRR